jgi:hypothetical protein
VKVVAKIPSGLKERIKNTLKRMVKVGAMPYNRKDAVEIFTGYLFTCVGKIFPVVTYSHGTSCSHPLELLYLASSCQPTRSQL